MTTKRFTTNGYYIYDHFKEDKWLVNEVEAEEIVMVMTNLDTKARERSKALSKLQKENEQLKQSYKEFEDECQSTFNAMSRKQDDLYRKNFKLKEENERLRRCINEIYTIARLEEV